MNKNRSKRKTKKTATQSLVRLRNSFRWSQDVGKMLKVLESGSLRHDEYHQYIKIEHLEKMILGNKMLFRRGNSPALDDWQECKEFGDSVLWSRTYIGCFCHERIENVALWWMYGKGCPDAVRLTLSRCTFRRWIDRLSRETSFKVPDFDEFGRATGPTAFCPSRPPFVSDIAYATIRKSNKGSAERGKGTGKGLFSVSWDGTCRHVGNLAGFIKTPEATGRFKDYEWRFERETRILIEIKSDKGGPDQIVVPCPLSSIVRDNGVRITAGPWMPERKYDEMKYRLESLFHVKGLDSKSIPIERSCLTGALNYR